MLGFPCVSQCDRPHDLLCMVVDLCHVLNPCSTMCHDSGVTGVALLTNQEGSGEEVVVEST